MGRHLIFWWVGDPLGDYHVRKENWLLITFVQVEFEKYMVEVQSFKKNTGHSRGIYKIYPKFIKEKSKDVNM